MRISLRILTLAAYAALGISCSRDPITVAGGSSGTENERTVTVAGTALDAAGIPVAGATVRLRPDGYLAEAGARLAKRRTTISGTVTGAHGRFSIGSVLPGSYVIEVTDRESIAAIMEVHPESDDTLVNAGSLTLRPFASIQGVVALTPDPGEVTVLVYGLERTTRVNPSTGLFTVTDLPSGSFELRIAAASSEYGAAILPIERIAPSVDTTVDTVMLARFGDEEYGRWSSRTTIRINTSPGGADVTEDIVNFPLLLRLDGSKFDFARADRRGRDIRFSTPTGTRLRYEIERWEPRRKTAAVWVLVDTIRGNNSQQSIIMHWGMTGAPDFSTGAAVFDTARGFAGVWHLSKSNGQWPDATANRNAGTGAVPAPPVRGIAGDAQLFDGIDDVLTCGGETDLAFAGAITLSAWIRLAETASELKRYHRIISKKLRWDAQAGYEMVCNPGLYGGGALDCMGRDSTLARARVEWDANWHHCVIACADTTARLWFDGREIPNEIWWFGGVIPGDAPLRLGGNGIRDFFAGTLDEVRVASVLRDGAWIKLTYETQKPGASILTFSD